MKYSVMSVVFAMSLSAAPIAASAQNSGAAAFQLAPAHAALAGPQRARIETYGGRLKKATREAFAALTRGVFEYALRVRALIEAVGGLGLGLREELVRVAQRSIVRGVTRSRGPGRGLVNAVIAQWKPLFRGLRAAFNNANGREVVQALEARFHSVAISARSIFYGAIASGRGTVRALLTGLSESLEPRLRAIAEAARKDSKATRRRFDAARAKPVS